MLFGIHPVDLAIVVLYIVVVIWLGKKAQAATRTEEGFFLAGRKLGKVYQFFLNFGNATEPQGATSTSTLVYTKGASGIWLSFQTIFINPYQWFMNMWFRRVRLTTMGDLFEDRFDSKWLSRVYALYQIVVAVLLIGFGCFTALKITSSLMLKPEAQWTAAEQQSVAGFFRLKELDKQAAATALTPAEKLERESLLERSKRNQLPSVVSYLAPRANQWIFCLAFVAVVGAYIMLGGMKGAAFNDALQSVLIIVFSLLLIPTGFYHIGGWSALREKVPGDMLKLVGQSGTDQFTFWNIVAITLVSVIQMNALSPNMAIFGSAKNEFAARFGGVIGTYAKRFMIILWAFAGLIALAMYSGANALADPDLVWGKLSKDLLGTGLIGLMLAGVIAAVMSNLAAKAVAISSLFVRNLYRHIWPEAPEARALAMARWTIVAVLLAGAVAAVNIPNIPAAINWVLTVNVPFGAVILLMFFWRRLTAAAVWCAILLCLAITIFPPFFGEWIPAVAEHPALTRQVPGPNGRPVAVFFASSVHANPDDLASPLVGKGRFNMEAYVVSKFGVDVDTLTPNGRLNIQFFFDGIFPFVVMLLVSLFTKASDRAHTDFFYGKMKTPVGTTPELEAAAMKETRRNPCRFDHTKLFPGTDWEFARWDKVDAIGFIACCAASTAIIGILVGLLQLAAG